jgi:hypothetical protein
MMIDFLTEPILGVGTLAGDPYEDMDDAIQITTFVLRHFAHMAGECANEIDLAQDIKRAQHLTRQVDAHYALHLAVLPATGMLQLPADHLALLTITTRHWKRGRARIIAAADALIAEFLSRTQRTPEQVGIQCVPHTRVHRYFSYQVFIRRPALPLAQVAAN